MKLEVLLDVHDQHFLKAEQFNNNTVLFVFECG